MSEWQPDKINFVKALHKSGATREQIAEVFKTTWGIKPSESLPNIDKILGIKTETLSPHAQKTKTRKPKTLPETKVIKPFNEYVPNKQDRFADRQDSEPKAVKRPGVFREAWHDAVSGTMSEYGTLGGAFARRYDERFKDKFPDWKRGGKKGKKDKGSVGEEFENAKRPGVFREAWHDAVSSTLSEYGTLGGAIARRYDERFKDKFPDWKRGGKKGKKDKSHIKDDDATPSKSKDVELRRVRALHDVARRFDNMSGRIGSALEEAAKYAKTLSKKSQIDKRDPTNSWLGDAAKSGMTGGLLGGLAGAAAGGLAGAAVSALSGGRDGKEKEEGPNPISDLKVEAKEIFYKADVIEFEGRIKGFGIGQGTGGGTGGAPGAGGKDSFNDRFGGMRAPGTNSDGTPQWSGDPNKIVPNVAAPGATGATSGAPGKKGPTQPGGDDPKMLQPTLPNVLGDTKNLKFKNVSGGKTVAELMQSKTPPTAAAVDAALKQEGMHEVRDRQDLGKFLSKGGKGLDPARTAWCARWVNQHLADQGIAGTSSNIANSFQRWGFAVPDLSQIQKGDALIEHRGKGPDQPGGHVGFATGKTRMKNGELEVEMLSGNASDAVTKDWRRASKLMARRAGEKELVNAKKRAPLLFGEGPGFDNLLKPDSIGSKPGQFYSGRKQFGANPNKFDPIDFPSIQFPSIMGGPLPQVGKAPNQIGDWSSPEMLRRVPNNFKWDNQWGADSKWNAKGYSDPKPNVGIGDWSSPELLKIPSDNFKGWDSLEPPKPAPPAPSMSVLPSEGTTTEGKKEKRWEETILPTYKKDHWAGLDGFDYSDERIGIG